MVRGAFPWFPLLELASRLYTRNHIDRGIATRLATRRAVDRAVAFGLQKRGSGARATVVAPTLCARRTFAAAHRIGMACVLLEDLPDLRSLATTLDDWATLFPDCPLLRNHRARRGSLVDQCAERELADTIVVRGGHAWNRLCGRFGARLCGAARVVGDTCKRPAIRSDTVLVAGPAIGRSGTAMLADLAERSPHLSFAVQAGRHLEPTRLFEHPRIRAATKAERHLDGVGVVASLSGVECNPSELLTAVQRGVPVVGTGASTGQLEVASTYPTTPLDVGAISAALAEATKPDARAPRPWKAPRSIIEALGGPSLQQRRRATV